jgi:hypothetical protein
MWRDHWNEEIDYPKSAWVSKAGLVIAILMGIFFVVFVLKTIENFW